MTSGQCSIGAATRRTVRAVLAGESLSFSERSTHIFTFFRARDLKLQLTFVVLTFYNLHGYVSEHADFGLLSDIDKTPKSPTVAAPRLKSAVPRRQTEDQGWCQQARRR